MKIIIKDKIAEAVMNLDSFKRELSNTLNLKSSVINNLINVEEKIKENIYLSVDWGQFIKQMILTDNKKIKFFVNKVLIKDVIQYYPDELDVSNEIFSFKEKIINKEDFLVTHELNIMEHHIERLIGDDILSYVEPSKLKGWKIK